jgi:hypothetical protein
MREGDVADLLKLKISDGDLPNRFDTIHPQSGLGEIRPGSCSPPTQPGSGTAHSKATSEPKHHWIAGKYYFIGLSQ